MADVSHELGSLRHLVDSPLSSKVAMFNNQANQHKQTQLLNPFSDSNGRVSPKPGISKDQVGYGKPLAGSLTEARGQKANMHVMREMLELCQIIDSEGYKVNDEPSMRVIPFGELFNIYNYISDKVVGLCLRARKHKLLDFEGEMLFQRRDDNVPIFLLKPILEIRRELQTKIEDIKRGSSPAPMATTLLMNKGAVEQKLQEAGLNVPQNGPKSRTPSPKQSKANSPAVSKTSTPASSKAASPTRESKPVPPTPESKPVKSDIETPKVVIDAPPATADEVAVEPASAPIEEKQHVEPQAVEEQAPVEVNIIVEEKPVEEAKQTENDAPMPEATQLEAATAAEAVPAPVEIESTASADVNTNKTDVNNNNTSGTTEIPTVVIEATAVFERSATTEAEEEKPADAVATENAAA